MSLSDSPKKSKCTIIKIKGGRELFSRMGLIKGAIIEKIKCAPLKDPIEFVINGCYHLALARKLAKRVLVKENK